MALNRILLPVLMIASTTAVLLNDANEDTHQSMVAEVSTLKSQMQSLHQENAGLKLRVQIKDLQAEVATLRRGNSMLQRQGKVLVGGVQEGDWVRVAYEYPTDPLQVFGQSASTRNNEIEAWNGFLLPGTIGKIVKFGPSKGQWVEEEQWVGEREPIVNGNIDLEEGDAGVYWLIEGKIIDEANQSQPTSKHWNILNQVGALKKGRWETFVEKLQPGDRITVNKAVLKMGHGLQGISNSDGIDDTAPAREAEEKCWEDPLTSAREAEDDDGFKLVKTPEETDPDGIYAKEGAYFWNVECGGKIYAFESAWISVYTLG